MATHDDKSAPPRQSDAVSVGPAVLNKAPDSKKVELLSAFANMADNASVAYLWFIGFLAYTMITVVASSDATVVQNGLTVPPFINLSVPFKLFFRVAPLVLPGLFAYFAFYHYRATRLLRELNEQYGSVDPSRVRPWFSASAATADGGIIGIVERVLVKISLWWLLPSSLILFLFWDLRITRDWMDFACTSAGILIGTVLIAKLWAGWDPGAVIGRLSLFLCALIAVGCAFVLLKLVIRRGYPTAMPPQTHLPVGWRDRLGAFVRDHTAPDLSNVQFKDVRTFDTGYLEGAKLVNVTVEPGFQGDDIDFQSADLEWAHLESAKLENAHFDRANLNGADLRNSNLNGSVFDSTFMFNTDLQAVTAYGTSFQSARLVAANLRGAQLVGANLKLADVRAADLSDALLVDADLEGADIRGATLKPEQLLNACTLYATTLDDIIRKAILTKNRILLDKPKRDESGECCNLEMQNSEHCWEH